MEENKEKEKPKRPLRVLVVDDQENIIKLLKRILEQVGIKDVLEAYDGATGIKVFRSHRPDLVITDYLMPEKDGIELLKFVKKIRPKIPVIMFTGFIDKLEAKLEIEKIKPDFILNKANIKIPLFIDVFQECFPDRTFIIE